MSSVALGNICLTAVPDAGTDAQAEVSVRLEENGKIVTGRGADTDTLVASAKAYVAALSKLTATRDRLHAQRTARMDGV